MFAHFMYHYFFLAFSICFCLFLVTAITYFWKIGASFPCLPIVVTGWWLLQQVSPPQPIMILKAQVVNTPTVQHRVKRMRILTFITLKAISTTHSQLRRTRHQNVATIAYSTKCKISSYRRETENNVNSQRGYGYGRQRTISVCMA
jgi:hypothetical protein